MQSPAVLCATQARSSFTPLLHQLPGEFSLTFAGDVPAMQHALLESRFDVVCADWELIRSGGQDALNALLERGNAGAMLLATDPASVPMETTERLFAVLPLGCSVEELDAVFLAAASQ